MSVYPPWMMPTPSDLKPRNIRIHRGSTFSQSFRLDILYISAGSYYFKSTDDWMLQLKRFGFSYGGILQLYPYHVFYDELLFKIHPYCVNRGQIPQSVLEVNLPIAPYYDEGFLGISTLTPHLSAHYTKQLTLSRYTYTVMGKFNGLVEDDPTEYTPCDDILLYGDMEVVS